MDQHNSGLVGFHEVDEGPNLVAEAVAEPYGNVARPRAKVNPFICVLWLLAAVLVTGGMAALLSAPLNVQMTDRVTMAYVLFTFGPQSVFIGVATFLALLFWHA